MKAIVVKPGEKDSIHMRDMPDPKMKPDQVAVKMIRVGLCGTDAEINHGLYGKAPDGDEFLILGHENLGVVEEVGKKVTGWKPGDLVVATVRRPCGVCPQCKMGENDMCSSGKYTERGIMRRHGYMAEYYTELPMFLNKIPREIRDFAVLLEPMSVVQKGIDHTYLLQHRLKGWKPKLAMVLGAGPIGLLAAAVLRVRGLRTVVVGREDPTDHRAQIVKQLGAEYVCVANKALPDVPKETGFPDIVIEATGVSRVVFDAMEILGANGVLCLLSVTGGDTMNAEPIDLINQRLVLGNQVVFGSVNANPRHFKQGVKDFVTIQKKWPGTMTKLLTNRIPWREHKKWFIERGTGIKSTLEIES
ncbi:MAG TPA: glucose 1-dehydrogenase [Vicinamibacterales bacterium]|jgi:threonine dehydrogenase-like Zn-dependent dehydrogenase|nr:glucose 1-dehydrogenase [Vicinamibacterales bacterium]